MSTVTADIAVSLDGFAAGPNQSEELPFGEGLEDEQLHTWMFEHGAEESRGGWAGGDRCGAATLNQYLSLGAIDELRLHVVPITLGAGERVFDGVTGLTFDIGHVRPTEHVVHLTLYPSWQVIPSAGFMPSVRMRIAALLAAVVATAVVSSCGESSPTPDAQSPKHNAADVTFAQNMIPHHQQALDMSAMVPSRTTYRDLIRHGQAHLRWTSRRRSRRCSELLQPVGRTARPGSHGTRRDGHRRHGRRGHYGQASDADGHRRSTSCG